MQRAVNEQILLAGLDHAAAALPHRVHQIENLRPQARLRHQLRRAVDGDERARTSNAGRAVRHQRLRPACVGNFV